LIAFFIELFTKRQEAINKLELELAKINLKFDILLRVLNKGGKNALDNCRFYIGSYKLVFFSSKKKNFSKSKIKSIIEKLNLPDFIKTEIR